MNGLKSISICLAIFCHIYIGWCAPLDYPAFIKVKITPTQNYVGGLFHMMVEIQDVLEKDVHMPDWGQVLPDSFDLLPPKTELKKTESGLSVFTYSMAVQIFEVNTFFLNDVKVTIKGSEYHLPPLFFEVLTSLNDEEKDIRPPYGAFEHTDAASSKITQWMVVVSGILICTALGVWLFLRLRKKRAEVLKPPVPPWEEALLAWQSLVNHNYIERGLYHEYYFKLSQLLRHYLNRRFLILAEEKTTEELIEMLRSHPEWQTHAGHLLDQFFIESDWVKFAKGKPANENIKNATMLIHDFIVNTTPKPITQDPLDKEAEK